MRKKIYCGIIPDLDKWEGVGFIKSKQIGNWAVFKKIKTSTTGWSCYKIASATRMPKKANYELAWNGERFASSASYQSIIEHRPELFKEFCKLVNFGEDDITYEQHAGDD